MDRDHAPPPSSLPSAPEGLGLDESHRRLEARGFDDAQFSIAHGAQVHCGACGRDVMAGRMRVHSQKRVEGVSDPDDESLVFGLECPACGARGTLTAAYGPRAGRDEAAVVADLPPPQR